MKTNIKETLESMTPRGKIFYIWQYYKVHIIGTIATLIILVSIVHSLLDKKEIILNMTLVGQMIDTQAIYDLEEKLNTDIVSDKTEEEVNVQYVKYSKTSLNQASMIGIQKITAELTAGSIDLLVVEKELFNELLMEEQLVPLNNFKGFNGIDLQKHDPYYSNTSKEEIYGVSTSEVKSLSAIDFDENKILCIPANTNNHDTISKFFTLIDK